MGKTNLDEIHQGIMYLGYQFRCDLLRAKAHTIRPYTKQKKYQYQKKGMENQQQPIQWTGNEEQLGVQPPDSGKTNQITIFGQYESSRPTALLKPIPADEVEPPPIGMLEVLYTELVPKTIKKHELVIEIPLFEVNSKSLRLTPSLFFIPLIHMEKIIELLQKPLFQCKRIPTYQ